MKSRLYKVMGIIAIVLCFIPIKANSKDYTITSPDGKLKCSFLLDEEGIPEYSVLFSNVEVISDSRLGFILGENVELNKNFTVVTSSIESFSETWKPKWGTKKSITNSYNELKVELKQKETEYKLTIVFRVFDDGVGFRYEFPEQEGIKDFIIMDELTGFNFTADHSAWWIPGDHDSYEYTYMNTKISEIDLGRTEYSERWDRFASNMHSVNTPVTFETEDGNYISIHEANLTDYAGMTLIRKGDFGFEADLVPWADGTKVKAAAPFNTPWRTIQVAKSAAELLTSDLIVNLNDPPADLDYSWIEPMKYVGIWWEMHINKSSWARTYVEGSWSGKDGLPHGANTLNAINYIDLAAKNNIKGVLVEGWNTGWEYWGADTTGFFDFVTPYDDFDIKAVIDYAKQKGVELVGHHETAGDVENYDKRVEEAFKYYNSLGVRAVKTGYAGAIRPKGERHHGQYMVRHYRKVLETALKYHIMVDAHEPIKATGLRRTYPNMMTREGVKGMEWNAWSSGNMPEHTTVIPFTRGLAGPIDYTPGIFDISIDSKDGYSVHSTIANQLALMVVIYSPLQMASDLAENYEGNPAIEFIREVETDWDQTRILNARIGDYLTIAREAKGKWFIGSITDENARELEIKLDFLKSGVNYTARIFADAEGAHYETNPEVIDISQIDVNSLSTLKLKLAPGGGQAIIISEK